MTDAITAKLVRRFGPSAAEWTAGLPALVADCARRWRLEVGEPFGGGALSVAIRVTTADGRPAVLKLSPDAPSLAEQAGMLRMFEPSGRVPAVLADAPGALLLEAVQPGTEMDDVPQQPTPAQFAELLADLHAVDPPPGVDLRDVRELADEFVRGGMGQLVEPAVAARLHRSDFERALDELDTLSATPSPTVLLHGDLHLGNVLDGGPRGLVAIDPMACVGDRCWDAVDYVLDGAGRTTASSTDCTRCPPRHTSMPSGCMPGVGWSQRPPRFTRYATAGRNGWWTNCSRWPGERALVVQVLAYFCCWLRSVYILDR